MENDMNLVYRCYSCGKFVFKNDILYSPHCCRKCGGNKVNPISGLTWFGVKYCKFWNWWRKLWSKSELLKD